MTFFLIIVAIAICVNGFVAYKAIRAIFDEKQERLNDVAQDQD